ncbi:TIGR03749 family integrating conjugative element protein [Lelliottia amnigena]|uniref:TIGR03749 family integrating conjugative element protein n=1 Tax=Lelliottia amnigena TaxID=61646 RepID=UPI0040563E3B
MTRLLMLLVLCLPCYVQALEILRWERMPLALPLRLDQERVVFIDRPIRVGVPAELEGKLRVQSAGGAVYLLAREVIGPSRLQLQDVETGELILVDIAATAPQKGQPPLEAVRIIADDSSVTRPDGMGSVKGEETSESPIAAPQQTPIPVVLTRYAAQSLYAPLRTVEPLRGVDRTRLRSDLPLHTLLPGLPLRFHALAAWRLDEYWVTAVRLRNTTHSTVQLDPRELQGDFIAATFQHSYLGPAGQASDTTVVYLVTRGHDLVPSLLPSVSPFDASHHLSGQASEKGGPDGQ